MNRGLICILAAVSLGGCAAGSPRTEPIDPAQLPRQIRRPQLRQRDFQARARLTLEDADEQRITLDALLLAKLPGQARVRCWKFDRLALEWGLTQGKPWVWRSTDAPQDRDPGGAFPYISEFLPRVASVFEHPEEWRFIERSDSGRWRYQSDASPGWRIVIEVEGESKTIAAITMSDTAHSAEHRLMFEEYQERQGALLPWRITASGPRGRVTLRIIELTLDAPAAAGAFEAPKGARELRGMP